MGEKGYFESEGPRHKKVTGGPGWLRYASVAQTPIGMTGKERKKEREEGRWVGGEKGTRGWKWIV